MAKQYTREELLGLICRYERKNGFMPGLRDMRIEFGVYDEPWNRVFGSWENAKSAYRALWEDKVEEAVYEEAPTAANRKHKTTLVIPDAHVSPGQDLTRFKKLGQLIVDKQPDRIISLGDFLSLDSMSGWDLAKSGNMEGKRYSEDIQAGKDALQLMLQPLKNMQGQQRYAGASVYTPRMVFIKGNHCDRVDRYLETRPELKEHMSVDKDLELNKFGFSDIVAYRESIEFDGVLFTHAPMNAANQPVSGKYAIHRAAEMTAKSLVFGHTHRQEVVNYYRHGSGELTQIVTGGALFEGTDSYAYGALNAYFRGLMLLTHYKEGRFDYEVISLERLNELY